jgi:hypothetical protein
LKIAEDPEEALWHKFKKAREGSIQNLKESLIIEKAMMEMADAKLRSLKGGKKK